MSESRKLFRLCVGYFLCYVGTGVAVKYFTEISSNRMSQLTFLVCNTMGSSLFVFAIILFLGWHRLALKWITRRDSWPILISGFCTAIVIPTTTLMYLLPISVMVAMVIMRGSVIVISRLVDAIQIRQGILKKRVSGSEELAVLFSLLGVGTSLLAPAKGRFEFLHNTVAITVLGSYLSAYAIRLYIMNIYKNRNTEKGSKLDNRVFFTIEQAWATLTMFVLSGVLLISAHGVVKSLKLELSRPLFHAVFLATGSGLAYAGVACFSVFIFMFPGRTATFAGVANRLTSLTAGTISTLILAVCFNTSYPSRLEWISMFWITVSTGLLVISESGGLAHATLKLRTFLPGAVGNRVGQSGEE